jgi:hypothetical protein
MRTPRPCRSPPTICAPAIPTPPSSTRATRTPPPTIRARSRPSTDHGRTDEGRHGKDSLKERTIYYLISGPSADPNALTLNPRIVDIAVPALAHLGIEIEPAWDLDGRINGLRQTSIIP